MALEVCTTKIEGVKLIRTLPHIDDRGAFYESYNKAEFETAGLPTEWLQDNISYTNQGVIRGMHVQKESPQGKLIRCLVGSIWDCWVDVRPGSKTLGNWEAVSLGSSEVEAVYLPPGIAHGFFVPTVYALVHYKCTTLYNKESDSGIRFDDPKVGILWPFENDMTPLVSPKDMNLPMMDEYIKSLG